VNTPLNVYTPYSLVHIILMFSMWSGNHKFYIQFLRLLRLQTFIITLYYYLVFSVYNVLRCLSISIFHCLLSLHCSSFKPLSLTSSRTPSVQLRLGLPFLFLLCGVHNHTCFGSPPLPVTLHAHTISIG
jgi:hypothetical protein